MPIPRFRSRIQSTAGGVMTEEVGAVTGDLDVETTFASDRVDVKIAYAGADEWYTPRGSPLRRSAGPIGDLGQLHRRQGPRRQVEPDDLQGVLPEPGLHQV